MDATGKDKVSLAEGMRPEEEMNHSECYPENTVFPCEMQLCMA